MQTNSHPLSPIRKKSLPPNPFIVFSSTFFPPADRENTNPNDSTPLKPFTSPPGSHNLFSFFYRRAESEVVSSPPFSRRVSLLRQCSHVPRFIPVEISSFFSPFILSFLLCRNLFSCLGSMRWGDPQLKTQMDPVPLPSYSHFHVKPNSPPFFFRNPLQFPSA